MINNNRRKIKFSSLGGEDDEHNAIVLVEISPVFAMQDEFSYGAPPFDRVWLRIGLYQVGVEWLNVSWEEVISNIRANYQAQHGPSCNLTLPLHVHSSLGRTY